MSTDDPADDEDEVTDDETAPATDGADDDLSLGTGDDGEGSRPNARDVRERIEQEADRAVEQFDDGIVDLLSWVLDTETRARIYAQLRTDPHSTSDEIAQGTGLYPSTVREALAELNEEEKVTRRKRESEGAGNNPYEYAAIAPSDLVGDIVDDVQQELNTVFNLDRYLDRDADGTETDAEPVSIEVDEEDGGDGTVVTDDASDADDTAEADAADADEAAGDDGSSAADEDDAE